MNKHKASPEPAFDGAALRSMLNFVKKAEMPEDMKKQLLSVFKFILKRLLASGKTMTPSEMNEYLVKNNKKAVWAVGPHAPKD